MKKCPECDEAFGDQQNFCDIDGSPLVDDITLLQTALQDSASHLAINEAQSPRFSWPTALIGVLIGIILCLLAVTFKLALFPESKDSNRQSTSTSRQPPRPVSNQVASTQKPQPEAEPEAETPADETTEPDSETSQVADSTPVETTVAGLNNGPVSTGAGVQAVHTQTLIKLKDGSSVAADAAWEDSQGVWYRRGGLVSFVDRKQVERIVDVGQAAPTSGPDKNQ